MVKERWGNGKGSLVTRGAFDGSGMVQENKRCPSLCGPVAQLGARFHGMEEVIGSIPIRSTNIPFINSQLPAPASSLLRLRGCGRVLKFLQIHGQHPSYDF